MNTVYLSLGSDLGDRIANLQSATNKIHASVGKVVSISNIYETPPLGFDSETIFLNICIELISVLSPERLLHSIQEIEKTIGRTKKTKDETYSSRLIDIDIIFFGKKILINPELTIPHSHFRSRNFVLYPLSDICPKTIDPVTNLTITQLKDNSPDNSLITRNNNQVILPI